MKRIILAILALSIIIIANVALANSIGYIHDSISRRTPQLITLGSYCAGMTFFIAAAHKFGNYAGKSHLIKGLILITFLILALGIFIGPKFDLENDFIFIIYYSIVTLFILSFIILLFILRPDKDQPPEKSIFVPTLFLIVGLLLFLWPTAMKFYACRNHYETCY